MRASSARTWLATMVGERPRWLATAAKLPRSATATKTDMLANRSIQHPKFRDPQVLTDFLRQGAVARIRPGETRPEILVPPGSNGLSNGQGMLVDSAHG